jgi:hypothetical protein
VEKAVSMASIMSVYLLTNRINGNHVVKQCALINKKILTHKDDYFEGKKCIKTE